MEKCIWNEHLLYRTTKIKGKHQRCSYVIRSLELHCNFNVNSRIYVLINWHYLLKYTNKIYKQDERKQKFQNSFLCRCNFVDTCTLPWIPHNIDSYYHQSKQKENVHQFKPIILALCIYIHDSISYGWSFFMYTTIVPIKQHSAKKLV